MLHCSPHVEMPARVNIIQIELYGISRCLFRLTGDLTDMSSVFRQYNSFWYSIFAYFDVFLICVANGLALWSSEQYRHYIDRTTDVQRPLICTVGVYFQNSYETEIFYIQIQKYRYKNIFISVSIFISVFLSVHTHSPNKST